jgi:hypothetical protein
MMTRSENAFVYGTTRFGEEKKEAKTYGRGRRCSVSGCGALLSMYNPSDVCSLHETMPMERKRPGPPAVDAGECRCHIMTLIESGMTIPQISKTAMVAETVIRRIANGAQENASLMTIARVMRLSVPSGALR